MRPGLIISKLQSNNQNLYVIKWLPINWPNCLSPSNWTETRNLSSTICGHGLTVIIWIQWSPNQWTDYLLTFNHHHALVMYLLAIFRLSWAFLITCLLSLFHSMCTNAIDSVLNTCISRCHLCISLSVFITWDLWVPHGFFTSRCHDIMAWCLALYVNPLSFSIICHSDALCRLPYISAPVPHWSSSYRYLASTASCVILVSLA